MDQCHNWRTFDYIAWDIETSGSYPLSSEIIELGAVRWSSGKIVDTYVSFFKPKKPIPVSIQAIHGINDEMVQNAPQIEDCIQDIIQFFKGAILLAHHAPFDMGFLTIEIERRKLPLPSEPVLCTSLLSRKWIPEAPNHKLQTLIEFLSLKKGNAHRALDDAQACLELAIKCFERIPDDRATMDQISKSMGKPISWSQFQVFRSHNNLMQDVASAIETQKDLEIVYSGGTRKGIPRRVTPIGFIRNPDGDFIVAYCHLDQTQKRFYLKRIADWLIV